MAKYQQYEEYKDSTVIWLKDLLPKTWTLSRIKYLCYVNDGNHGEEYPKESDYTDSQNGVPFIRGGNLGNYAITDEGMLYITHIKNNSMRKGRLKKGDILFVNRGEIGKLALVTEKHAGSNLNSQIAYLRVNNNKLINKYLLYYLDSSYVSNFLVSMKMGSVLTQFPIGDLLDIHVPLPLAEEQIQIANFLDHETAQIDTLIDKQQTLIQLLKEKRQAVISHAVTKGLNSDAPMKDSGVEWLGEVPEHWTIKSYRYASEIYRGKFGHRPRNDPAFYDGEYPFIQTGDVARAGKVITSYSQTLNEKGKSVSQLFPSGTLMMAIAANIGDTAILGFEAYAPDSVVGFKPYKGVDIEFLRYSFLAALPAFEQTSTQSTQANLNVDRIGAVKGAFPSFDEQKKIVSYLDKMLEHYEAIEVKVNEQIQLMQERRTALISAAVTGKIDVRGWRAPE